jgi:hypothetical protein
VIDIQFTVWSKTYVLFRSAVVHFKLLCEQTIFRHWRRENQHSLHEISLDDLKMTLGVQLVRGGLWRLSFARNSKFHSLHEVRILSPFVDPPTGKEKSYRYFMTGNVMAYTL